MTSQSITGRTQWPGVGFLSLAVLLHLGMLFLPVTLPRHAADSGIHSRLELTLIRMEHRAASIPVREAKEATDRNDSAAMDERPPLSADLRTPFPAAQSVLPESTPEAAAGATLSTAVLLHQAQRDSAVLAGERGEARSGETPPFRLPDHRRVGQGARLLRTGPGEPGPPASRTRIVDRWAAADGSYHVRIELPGGEILCGRAQPWDPLQPLVEPVMHLRSCGARPSFTMPPER